ncbi:hypothetical protein B484DRAFT_472597 [Ochromonadaceae sp. CCMP2298]|nr:hypothetical protein B484DRAFT_472597 [Ochromonadaceae sp. CCMP2298]
MYDIMTHTMSYNTLSKAIRSTSKRKPLALVIATQMPNKLLKPALQTLATDIGIKRERVGWRNCCSAGIGNRDDIFDTIVDRLKYDNELFEECKANLHPEILAAVDPGNKPNEPVMVYNVRSSVRRLSEVVWLHRGNIDKYTLWGKAEVDLQKPEVDHILEIQLIEAAIREAKVPYTRSLEKALRCFFNSKVNLNVTTSKVNQSKKDPMTQWLNRQNVGFTLDDMRLPRSLVDSGAWARIGTSMVATWDDLHREENTQTGQVHDAVHGMLEKMGLI